MAIGETEIEVILETTGREHIEEIYQRLHNDNFKIKKEP
jgi:hypothetical protein